jgi:hypothetical protein
MTSQEQVDQIKSDVEALQSAGAAAADQIAVLTDQILSLQEGQITDEQITNLHNALNEVTSQLLQAVEQSQTALGGGQAPPEEGARFRQPYDFEEPDRPFSAS